MKLQEKKFTGILAFLTLLLTVNTARAQSVNTLADEARPGKLFVQMKVTPNAKEFIANVLETDSSSFRFKVWVANPKEAKININIRTENGDNIFSKRLSDAWYSQIYDLSSLDDGTYIIEIADNKTRFRRKVMIATNTYSVRTTKVF